MIKKTITYTDYDGNTRTEDFNFNLSKAELIEMEASEIGGMTKKLESIVKANDTKQIIEVFKDLIQKSYGVKSPDGKRFVKNKEVLDEFVQSEAYSELFTELASNDKAAVAFVNGILPKDIASQIAAQQNGNVIPANFDK